MTANFNHMVPGTLKSAILIEIRNAHTSKIAEELVRVGIISNEYLDKLLRLDMINNKLKPPPDSGFNDLQRIRKLNQLLQKHSIVSTASFISNLYS
jgi:hypothetical protein